MAQANAKPALVAALALAVLGAGVGVVFMRSAPVEEPVVVRAPAVVELSPPSSPSGPSQRPTAIDPALAVEPTPAASASPRPAAAKRNRMQRDLTREQIWSALDHEHELAPAKLGSAAPTEQDAEKLPQLDPQYIRSAIAEQLVPIMRECYETALEDEPELAGKLVAEFTIVGAEDIGGVVEEAAISEDSTLDSAFVRECVRESLMTVTFEPPEDGGRIVVRYPILFAPGD